MSGMSPARPVAPSPCDPATPAALMTLDDVGYHYPGTSTEILSGLSFDVPIGSVVAIVGPSGSGKTTLLSLISGLASPTSGTLSWSEELMSPTRHRLSMLFQTDTLLPWLTVEKNIGLHFTLTGQKKRFREARGGMIQDLMSMAGLTGVDQRYPYQLSGGMKRRAAFLASVVPHPQILLLDEPFASVDEPTRVSIHNDVHRIIKQFNITVLLVTHDLAEAVTLADKVVILSKSPAHVVSTQEIPFGDERDILHIRDDQRFLEIYGKLWEALSRQVRDD